MSNEMPIHITWKCPIDRCDCVLPSQVVDPGDVDAAEDARWLWYLEHAKIAHEFEEVFMSLRGEL